MVAATLTSGYPALAQPAGPKAEVTASQVKHRLVVLSDIEADPDDSQSLVRLLLYANQIEIEGLIATTSVHQKSLVAPETIHSILDAYGKVQPNLLKHEKGYPDARSLASLVSQGLPVYGMAGVGDGKDSPGSDFLIRVLEKNDPRPVWVAVWGGVNTLAQALYKIKQSRSPEEAARLTGKLRVYTISDQDDSGIWIRRNFPDIFYIVSPGGYGNATWGGINTVEAGFDNSEISNGWFANNIQQGHGPLGVMYPDVGYGVEGDTPTFLSLIPNGLNIPERPDWGGWGGRYTLYWRWRKDLQNDFAARMDWTTKSYKDANHPPVTALGHEDRFTVKSGTRFLLSAAGTTDPDGDSLTYLWFNYPEAGTLKDLIKIGSAENLYRVNVHAPVVTKPETAHFILKVTDKGEPSLTRYKRVVVTIVP
ncbi:MAG: hypothetical protein B7Z26_11630 [Asticcacaulis sp. 32-58-5]|nr:MAG: hypothetical protein B7Z26_11630 [Asticcacaulis sp. 32-58-5]